MDEHYWKTLASQWIHSKSQQLEIPTRNVPPPADNLEIADMEIEDEKEEEKLWNWEHLNQQPQVHDPTEQNFSQNQVPLSHFTHNDQQNNFSKQLRIPEPPNINSLLAADDEIKNSLLDHHNLIDMDMDSENEYGDDSNSNSASSGTMMTAQKKKLLPHWIREGLEKMKREKEQETARTQEELRLKEEEVERKRMMEEALQEIEREKVAKSKYDSSSDNDDDDENDSKTKKTDKVIPHTVTTTTDSKELEIVEDDEEAYEKMMLLVRKTLTSIMLEVTNEIIQEISNETLTKYRKKASATQSKPVIVGLGLGVYSSSSEEESGNEDKQKSDQSDWETNSILRDRIRQKSVIFEKRAKDVKDKLAKIAAIEDKMYKRKKEPVDQKVEKKYANDQTKDGGEEKYETKIYSISATSATRTREKRTRFSDPKEGRSTNISHVIVMQPSTHHDNGTASKFSSAIASPSVVKGSSPGKLEKFKKKRRDSSSSLSSSGSSHRKKQHKKHKKSSKHSKKSSKKRDRSNSRERARRSDRKSIESKSSVKSSAESHSRRSRSRSRDRHRRRY